MPGIFRFKQFDVDQTGCAMKINTDGVLLGALADAENPKTILDIGTGTGVIALMLAQRFADAEIDAVEIDEQAAQTAARNFAGSPFAERLKVCPAGFEQFFDEHPGKRYDLIVSNPPFFINSLKSPEKGRRMAKHADRVFFETLIRTVSAHLDQRGVFCLILPVDTAEVVADIVMQNILLLNRQINVFSYRDSMPHRKILFFSKTKQNIPAEEFVIYNARQTYSEEYIAILKDFFTIF